MNDDLLLLASAYLADDVTDDERARIEADPDAMALVEQLRVAQARIAQAEPPDEAVREQAIAAALAVFDARTTGTGADADPVTAATAATVLPTPASASDEPADAAVVPLRRSWLAPALRVAAACVAVGALGVVVVNLTGGEGTDDIATHSDAVAPAFDTDDDASSSLESADDSGLDEFTTRDAEPGDIPPGAMSDAADAADADDVPESGEPDETDQTVDGRISATEAGPALADEDELAELVRTLLDDSSVDAAPTPAPADGTTETDADGEANCENVISRVLSPAELAGRGVLVGVDADARRALAVDRTDCTLVADVPLDPSDD